MLIQIFKNNNNKNNNIIIYKLFKHLFFYILIFLQYINMSFYILKKEINKGREKKQKQNKNTHT